MDSHYILLFDTFMVQSESLYALLHFRKLRLQKRLVKAVLKCGKKRVWFDPTETNDIANANSRKLVRSHNFCFLEEWVVISILTWFYLVILTSEVMKSSSDTV